MATVLHLLVLASFLIAEVAFSGEFATGEVEPTAVGIDVVGTAFRVTLSDGSVRQRRGLAGMLLVFRVGGVASGIRIASTAIDPLDQTGAVLLHDLRIEETGAPFCSPGPDGIQAGFPLAGQTAPDGSFLAAESGMFELICTSGAQGKCVRLGYHPWEVESNGRSMRDHFNACVRLLRADYCGDGRSWTRDGTSVDLWDDIAIQRSDSIDEREFSFEAGWGPAGATCVARTRIPALMSIDKLRADCPWLRADEVCNEGLARDAGALLFNRSRAIDRAKAN